MAWTMGTRLQVLVVFGQNAGEAEDQISTALEYLRSKNYPVQEIQYQYQGGTHTAMIVYIEKG